jgi:hypothetical protein
MLEINSVCSLFTINICKVVYMKENVGNLDADLRFYLAIFLICWDYCI